MGTPLTHFYNLIKLLIEYNILITRLFPGSLYSVIAVLLFFGIFLSLELIFRSSHADFNCIYMAFTVSMQLITFVNIKKVNGFIFTWKLVLKFKLIFLFYIVTLVI